MFCDRTLNNKFYRIHEQALRITYKDMTSDFDTMLLRDKIKDHFLKTYRDRNQTYVCYTKTAHPLSHSCFGLTILNPIVVGLFDSTILVGGGAKKPPLPNSLLVIGRATKFGVLKASGMYFL